MPLLLESDPALGGRHHILSPGHGQRMNQNVDITNLHSIPDMIRYIQTQNSNDEYLPVAVVSLDSVGKFTK